MVKDKNLRKSNISDLVKDISRNTGVPASKVDKITKVTVRAWRKYAVASGLKVKGPHGSEVTEIAKRTELPRKVVVVVLADLRKHRSKLVGDWYIATVSKQAQELSVSERVIRRRFRQAYSFRRRKRDIRDRFGRSYPNLKGEGGERDDPGPFVLPLNTDILDKD